MVGIGEDEMEQDTHWRVSGVPSRPVTWASMNTWCPSNDVGATSS